MRLAIAGLKARRHTIRRNTRKVRRQLHRRYGRALVSRLKAAGEQGQLAHERTVEKKQAAWLQAHKLQ